MAKRERDPARGQFWRDTYTAWKAGGLTAREYCGRHGLAATAFHHWRRELRRRDAVASVRPAAGPRSLPLSAREVHDS